jgi:hypothetical protein
MSNGSKSLTAATYHLWYANEYLKDFKRDQKDSTVKYKAAQWEQKCAYLLNSVYESFTPKAKELFNTEIKNGDPLFYGDITEKLQRMTPEQRQLIDLICVNVLNGERIEVQDNSGETLTVNA